MEQFTSRLLAQMNDELQQIAVTCENRLQQAERSFHAVEKSIAELKAYITGYEFRNIGEEIRFFKEIKPEFQKELIYNEEILFIESKLPVGPQKARKHFIEQILGGIQAYFDKNSLIYNYWRSGATKYDELYFVRNPESFPFMPISSTDIDPAFSNPNSGKIAKLMAFAEVRDYLQGYREAGSQHLQPQQPLDDKPSARMVFTGPKAALEEILQGAAAKGWFNYGDLPISQLFREMGLALKVKLGDPSRGLIGMAIRKKGYTPHIDAMKDALEDKIKDKHQ